MLGCTGNYRYCAGMDVSVLVPARNEERFISEQLDALLAQNFAGSWELLVIDNGSTDRTAAVVQGYTEQDHRVRLINASDRPGKVYAAEKGVAASTGEVLIFCDADDVVGEDWMTALIRGLEHYDVVTGPNELHRLNPDWLATSRGLSADQPVGTFCEIFPFVRGNNFALKATTWRRLGGLRDGYFPCEDLEFSLRCWLSGTQIGGVPEALVHYRYRAGAKDLWRQGFAYGSHRPLIAKLLKEAGKPTPPRFGGWKSWLMLAVKLPTVVTRTGRASWLWIAGNRLGQVAGSIRYRTLML